MRSVLRLSLTTILTLTALAWGPCPCVVTGSFAQPVAKSGVGGHGGRRCCCCREESGKDAPARPRRGDDCPCCKYVGNGRPALQPESRPVTASPTLVAIQPAPEVRAPRAAPERSERFLVEESVGPPRDLRRGVQLIV